MLRHFRTGDLTEAVRRSVEEFWDLLLDYLLRLLTLKAVLHYVVKQIPLSCGQCRTLSGGSRRQPVQYGTVLCLGLSCYAKRNILGRGTNSNASKDGPHELFQD